MTRLLLIFCVLQSWLCLANAQIPDKIYYNKTLHYLNSNPLEVYFDQFPEKRPLSKIGATSLWRGYVATFEISDFKLWLIDVEVYKNH